MSRKFILALAAMALGSVTIATASADAMQRVRTLSKAPPQRIKVLVREPRRHLPPPVIVHGHPHWHHHFVMVDGRPVYDAAPVVATPGPCTCLTKDYTPEDLVIFKDVCTKETATTVVPGSPAAMQMQQQEQPSSEAKPEQTGEAPPSNSFAGKTYQEFMAERQQQSAAKQN
ncbi:MAG TPA: hypothetical protein VFB45_12095 [Pseudolabrys sp.]|nr:hypothetical protein [Pseudolabrys sp.]